MSRSSCSTAYALVVAAFAITAEAFRMHLHQAGIEDRIYDSLDALDVADAEAPEPFSPVCYLHEFKDW